MSDLSPKQRIKVLEMVTRIAAEAAGNHNVVCMIEFQEELIERLYRQLSSLVLEGEEETNQAYSYQYED